MSEESANAAASDAPKAADGSAKNTPVGQVDEWRPSWLNFPKSLMVMLFAPAIAFGIRYIFPSGDEVSITDCLVWASIGAGALSLPIYLAVSMIRKTTTLALYTDARVRFRSGIVARKTSEIMARDIRSIDVTQTTWERVLGIGTIGIGTAAQAEVEIEMKKTRNPEKIRSEINRFRDDDPSNDVKAD